VTPSEEAYYTDHSSLGNKFLSKFAVFNTSAICLHFFDKFLKLIGFLQPFNVPKWVALSSKGGALYAAGFGRASPFVKKFSRRLKALKK
jgi:hypothetical protein